MGLALLAAGFALAPAAALAQNAAETVSNTPATDAVGPRELKNFSLEGNVTRPVEQQPSSQLTIPARPQRPQAQTTPATTEPRPPAPATARTADTGAAPQQAQSEPNRQRSARVAQPLRQTPPSSSVTVALPQLDGGSLRGSASAVPASAASFPADTAGTIAPESNFPILPWLLAAIALGAGGAFLFWRNRSREALAGGPQFDEFRAPEPAPAPQPRAAPQPATAPPKATPPSIPGFVSTRLRPWIDIGFHPLRCIVEDERVSIEFEIELFNSGSAPARAVLIEATLINASTSQDQELGRFFANPVGEGERIAAIPPLKRVRIKTQVVTPREHVQVFEAAGRQVFVPVIAFNALYRWSNGEGQTSVSYLLGRDTQGEKMAPFRLDLGPRVFRGVGSRLLPLAVRK